MEVLSETLPIILSGLLAILVVVLIVLVLRIIKTLTKVEKIIDDVSNKSKKLDGIFNLVDVATDTLNVMGDKIALAIANGITSLFKRKKKGFDEDE